MDELMASGKFDLAKGKVTYQNLVPGDMLMLNDANRYQIVGITVFSSRGWKSIEYKLEDKDGTLYLEFEPDDEILAYAFRKELSAEDLGLKKTVDGKIEFTETIEYEGHTYTREGASNVTFQVKHPLPANYQGRTIDYVRKVGNRRYVISIEEYHLNDTVFSKEPTITYEYHIWYGEQIGLATIAFYEPAKDVKNREDWLTVNYSDGEFMGIPHHYFVYAFIMIIAVMAAIFLPPLFN